MRSQSESIVLRRLAAGSIEAALVALLLAGGLAAVVNRNWLYGWDTIGVGWWLLVLFSTLISAIPTQPLQYRLLGIRLTTLHGRTPPFAVRVARTLIFWILVAAVPSFKIGSVVRSAPFSAREQFVLTGAIALSIVLLPFCSVLLSGGRRGVHDALCGSVVVGTQRAVGIRKQARRFGPRFMSMSFVGLLVGVLCFALLIDWRFALSQRFASVFGRQTAYAAQLARTSRADAVADMFTVFDPEPFFVNQHAVLVGPVVTFRMRVPPQRLSTPRSRRLAIRESIVALVESADERARLIAVELYSKRSFGPLSFTETHTLLIDVNNLFVFDPPVRQWFYFGKDSVRFHEVFNRQEDYDSVAMAMGPQIDRFVFIENVVWNFPYLDLLEATPDPGVHFVGRR